MVGEDPEPNSKFICPTCGYHLYTTDSEKGDYFCSECNAYHLRSEVGELA